MCERYVFFKRFVNILDSQVLASRAEVVGTPNRSGNEYNRLTAMEDAGYDLGAEAFDFPLLASVEAPHRSF
jgi:hypothetical protein